MLKADETRKMGGIHRQRRNINLANINTNNLYKQEDGFMDESNINNASVINSAKKIDKIASIKIEEFDEQALKNLNFNGKNFDKKQNNIFINCNRLLYSKNCVYLYIGLIIISISVFIYSICGYFANLSKM
jgi:hypothetical protein